MITKEQFALKIEAIQEGKKIWDSIVKKYKIKNNDTVVLFPHVNAQINIVGCNLLSLYIDKRNPHRVIILSMEDNTLYPLLQKNIIWHQINSKQTTCLMAYYSLCDMGYNFILMSLTKPYGRFGEKVMEKNNISLEEVVAYGIYGLSRGEVNSEEINSL